MASQGLDIDSPNFEYFPPTPPSHSDEETDSANPKPTLKPLSSMPAVSPNDAPAPAVVKPSSAKVTLHLGHLPSKKDIKGPWPRTPTRVSFYTCRFILRLQELTILPSRSIRTTPRGQRTVDTMSIPLRMLPWASAFLQF